MAFAASTAVAAPRPERAPDLRHVHVGQEAVTAPTRHGPVRLTLDPALQRAAERLLDAAHAHEGAVVMSDVRTGRVLVWATRGDRDAVKNPIAPSASVFKTVTAAALLESGKVGLATKQCFSGGERAIEEADLRDDPRRDDQCSTFGQALGHSYNLVFARLALKHLTPGDLRSTAAEFGIGSEIPMDVRVPAGDVVVPEDRLGLARASAGFWNAHLSPLGALFMMQTVANKGERVRLSVLDTGEPTERISAGWAMHAQNAAALTHMLEVTTRSGTSARVFHEGPIEGLPHRIAGKTGTLIGGHPARMYSWFAGFAPAERPRVAIAVLLANDVKWWTKGNAVARDVLRAYFDRELASGG